MKFRYDINGLRALAVLAVVVFHFQPSWLTGGFAGVDVFFVISGFLMTSIIFTSLEKDQFSLVKFYSARANRIIPVLGAATLILMVFGWFYLIPNDYRELGRQVEKSILFYSNTYFAKGAGYFDTSETSKWLLHTWSLSVEWQFYIFFPLIIVFLKKYFNLAQIQLIVVGLFVLSFAFSIYATWKDSISAYFMLSTRAWEMLLGGLAFFYPLKNMKKPQQWLLQITGLVLIFSSYFIFSKETLWPGYLALLPTLGAFLIILSTVQNNFLLSNVIAQSIGKWSYSIYVWHWPLVVFGFYLVIDDWYLYGLPLSILLGFLSYQIIEKRKFPTATRWKEFFKSKPFLILLAIAAISTFIKKTDGAAFHYSDALKNLTKEIDNGNPHACDAVPGAKTSVYECVVGNAKNIKAIVVGDSHADSLTTAVANSFNPEKEGIVSLVRSGCPLVVDFNLHTDDENICIEYNQNRLKLIQEKYQGIPVIMIGRLVSYIDGQNDPERADAYVNRPNVYFGEERHLTHQQAYTLFAEKLGETLCTIRESNPVSIVQPIPEFAYSIPKILARDTLLNRTTDISLSKSDYLDRSGEMRQIIEEKAGQCGVQVLDPMPVLCADDQCQYLHEGRSLYRDGDHLSEYGNKLLVPLFKEI